MVKADYSRDYYNDLELNQNSDIAEIKRQYKKLALVYHPDRNIGKSNLDAAKFQRIQSAYEVLIDPLERARYDVNHRFDSSRNTSSSQTGYGQRGNPWSNLGKNYPPPPKPPTARNRPAPFSTDGTRRYEKFKPPQQSAYQATQEGAQARKATYEAWENTRSQQGSNKTDPGMRKNNGNPTPPPRSNHQPDRDERSYNQSKNSIPQRKNGFMPSTPGGDELPAPKGAYSTLHDKSRPPIPPRNPENDPIQNFSTKINLEPSLEPRVSTPYATHGGERFDPFNHINDASDSSRSSNASRKESPTRAPHLPPRVNTETKPPIPQNKSPSKEDSNSKPFHPSATDNIKKSESNDPKAARVQSPTFETSEASARDNKPNMYANSTFYPSHAQKCRPQNPTVSDEMFENHSISSSSKVKFSHEISVPIMNRSHKLPPLDFETTIRWKAGRLPSILYRSVAVEIFSFAVNDDMFNNNFSSQGYSFSNDAEKISTKFSAEQWDGKFAAGWDANCFIPETKPSQFNVRSKTVRSPKKFKSPETTSTKASTKPEPFETNFTPSLNPSTETSYRTKFSANDWAETFMPQIFMPASVPKTMSSSNSNRKRSGPNIRSNINEVAGVDVRLKNGNQDSAGRKSTTQDPLENNIPVPEPMDIDTPIAPASNFEPKGKINNSRTNQASHKRRVSQPEALSRENLHTAALKIKFSDLKIRDLILDFPTPPVAPTLPQVKKPGENIYLEYESKFEQYMIEWDQFDKKYLLHLVARKNQNENLGERRWRGNEVEKYRATVQEDQIVLKKWAEAKEMHDKALADRIAVGDIVKEDDFGERQRKNTV
ncbi:hypothetical protein similar to DnaJ domain-containing protein [Blumeria hordei DH14]|uniref:J domain-containing protein n=1 Tax=Blumeria graminis f. sp. hordei (strain DH14) TaxID=546991 RepID=N1JKN0_BLUG1|nr:hypothetical protein similar to DnaJ domain-containing protein [Blumeria hordei DH14]